MIRSKFIFDILDLLFDCDKDGLLLRNQFQYLTEHKYDYTGVGLFVSFTHSNDIYNFRLKSNTSVITDVEITSAILDIGASATVFIKNGIIDYLEILSYSGKYPKDEPIKYNLTQIWKGSSQKHIIR